MASKSRQWVKCPQCGTDVMQTGWTETAVKTKTYMRFNGRGAVVIATAEEPAERAECRMCQAALEETPLQLMRMA